MRGERNQRPQKKDKIDERVTILKPTDIRYCVMLQEHSRVLGFPLMITLEAWRVLIRSLIIYPTEECVFVLHIRLFAENDCAGYV